MALATAKLVITQVPCVGLTPRSPAIAGRDTLAIDVSSTFMKVAAERASVPHRRALPSSGGGGRGLVEGEDMRSVCWSGFVYGWRAPRPGQGGAGCVQSANCEVVGQCVAVVPWALLAAEATRWAPAALATGASAACDAAATLGL